jgi:integrase
MFLAEKWLIPSNLKYKISTLKSSFQCLKAAFNQARKLDYIESNPLFNVVFGELTASKVKPKKCKIESRELRNLTNQINSFSPDMKMMCFLCLGYLTRNRETALARWEHFNFNKMLWHIPAENTKTGQGISHPITPTMLVLLKKYRVWQRHETRTKFLFPQRKGYKPISESQAANKLAKLANRQFSLHDLRKYGSSYLRDMAVDYYIVERVLNHKMTTLDQTYIHTSTSKIMRNELEKWHSTFLKNGHTFER